MSPHEGLDDIARFSEEHPKSHMIDIFYTKNWIKPFVNKIKNHVFSLLILLNKKKNTYT